MLAASKLAVALYAVLVTAHSIIEWRKPHSSMPTRTCTQVMSSVDHLLNNVLLPVTQLAPAINIQTGAQAASEHWTSTPSRSQ
jgi:hypothetical protein